MNGDSGTASPAAGPSGQTSFGSNFTFEMDLDGRRARLDNEQQRRALLTVLINPRLDTIATRREEESAGQREIQGWQLWCPLSKKMRQNTEAEQPLSQAAVDLYAEAVDLDPEEPSYRTNRAAAYSAFHGNIIAMKRQSS